MTHPQIDNRTLFTGDNLEVMRTLNSESVDLIYLDPPFNKKFVFPIGKGDNKEFGYKDIWGWESVPDEHNPFLPYAELLAFNELFTSQHEDNMLVERAMAKKIVRFLEITGEVAGIAEMAYLSFMAARLVEMRRLLKPTGSIYLHCDSTMSHSLKLLMDIIFGGDNFRNEIVWHYENKLRDSRKRIWQAATDILLFYVKSRGNYTFNSQYIPLDKPRRYTKIQKVDGKKVSVRDKQGNVLYIESTRKLMDNVLRIPMLTGSGERTGYPTQKPLALLERVIAASSNEGDFVLDPFCGCATTCVAAERLDRQWCGIDVASHAADLVRNRLEEETQQGKLSDKKVPQIHHRELAEGDCPIRTDLGETRSKNIKQLLYGKQEGKCNLCKRHFEIRDFHIDHITPKSKGGPDVDRNLQLLCGSCNIIKGKKTMTNAVKRLAELGYIKAA